jgi:hypothetical protein
MDVPMSDGWFCCRYVMKSRCLIDHYDSFSTTLLKHTTDCDYNKLSLYDYYTYQVHLIETARRSNQNQNITTSYKERRDRTSKCIYG